MNWHKLKVINKTKVADAAYLIELEISVQLKSNFNFVAGQYLTIALNDSNNQKQLRCYSICSSKLEQNISFCVKHIKGGFLSSYLCLDINIGDELNVKIPNGNFILENLKAKDDILFIAGGSGITPIKAMTIALLNQNYKGKITLIYGNRDLNSVIFYDYFNDLSVKNKINLIYSFDNYPNDWDGETGPLTKEHLGEIFKKYKVAINKHQIYICAPQIVNENCVSILKDLNVKESSIHLERFFSLSNEVESDNVLDKEVTSTIVINNKSHAVQVKPKQNLLDAALEAGLDIDYSCKSGICSTCIAKVYGGKVYIAIGEGLSSKQKKENYILACQSYPLDDSVTINFDLNNNPVFKKRKIYLTIGILISLILVFIYTRPSNEIYLIKGEYNIGHESLTCIKCHKNAPGNTRQQLQASVRYWVGLNKQNVTVGKKKVDNKTCINCHDRPNDRHPVYRFREPRFQEVRSIIHPEKCVSCHAEHTGKRVTISEPDFCVNCHKDTKLVNDPIKEMSHEELIKKEKWNSCLQCHDFHGNHLAKIPQSLNDTIPIHSIKEYFNGEKDPYGELKKYIVELDSIKQ